MSAPSPKIILIASAPRSGGTWVFNAARLILQKAGLHTHAAWCADYVPNDPAPYHLVKAHRPDEISFTPWRTLTNYRALAECLASRVRMGWLKTEPKKIIAAAKKHQQVYDYWAERSDLEVQFNTIVNDPAKVVASIANAIEAPIESTASEDIAKALKELKAPTEGATYDPVTLLHPKHRSDFTATTMTAQEIRAVLEANDL